ncbi:MAG TPA: glycosyltransferase [Candidatus Angelobacter sp.]|nr:glycosyltransferase [Candidatus Angelobacter sp.]
MSNRLALSMIVRNGGEDFLHCLESVRGVVDEIVIADTGSTDSSIAIAHQFGAEVIHIPWTNDFAAARNAALAPVTADWVLVLDADEQLDEQARTQIPAALQAKNVEGHIVTIRNYVHSMTERLWDKPAIANDGRLARATQFAGYLEHENVRLFRSKPEIRFAGRVHETVGTGIEARGGKLGRTDFVIHHFGFTATAEQKAAKNSFYRELGQQKIQEMPDNAQAHFELGLVELDNFQNYEEASRLLARACELNPSLAVAWFFQGVAYARRQQDAMALPCYARARTLGIDSAPLAEAEADAFYNCQQFTEARKAYRKALQLRSSTDVLSKLGLTEVRLNQVDAGLKKIKTSVANSPATPELHDRLVLAELSLGHIAAAAQAAEDKLHAVQRTESGFLRAAALWLHAKREEHVLEILRVGMQEFPHSAELSRAFNQMEAKRLEAAQSANFAAH